MADRMAHAQEAITGKKAERYRAGHTTATKLLCRGLLKDIRDMKIAGNYLEVGAGPGTLAAIIAEQNKNITITTLDVSPDMVRAAREHVAKKGLNDRVQCVLGDVGDEKMMHSLGSFDFVYSTLSLHHWEDTEGSITNLWRAVKPGGVLYILDLKRARWLYYLPLGGGFAESIRAAYLPKEIGAMLVKTGIDKYKMKTIFPYFLQSVIAWK